MNLTPSNLPLPESERIEFVAQLFKAQEAERSHLARELHDEIGQTLTLVSLTLCDASKMQGNVDRAQLEECCEMVDNALDQVRSFSLRLQPPLLDELGLEATLSVLLDRVASRAGLTVQFDCTPYLIPLAPDLEITCYRLVQEALTNVVRHARAKRVWVRLARDGAQAEIVVQDDGIGFNLPTQRQRALGGESFGMQSMQQRVQLAGGTLEIQSAPLRGTTLRARLPINMAAFNENI